MIDIDYIMGKQKGSKPKAFALFAGTPKRKQSDPFKQLFQGQGHPIVGDRVTPAQRNKFVKAKKLRDPFILFTDHDGDGVISGLDCAPRNPKKHMAVQSFTPSQKERFSKLNTLDDAYGEMSDCEWGTCAPIAQTMQRISPGKVISKRAVWPNREYEGTHVVYVSDKGNVYDPINKFKGPEKEYDEQFKVRSQLDVTRNISGNEDD